MPLSLEECKARNREKAEASLSGLISGRSGDDISFLGWHELQMPTESELGTFDEKYTWLAVLENPIRLMEQQSDRFVLKSRRGNVAEPEVEGYTLLNILKRDDQQAYGARYLGNFFLFDHIPHEENLKQMMRTPGFFLAYARELGESLAKAYIMGGGENTHLSQSQEMMANLLI